MRLALLFFLFISVGVAQTPLDSLKKSLENHAEDTGKVDILNRIAFLNLAFSIDTMEVYANRAKALGEKLNYQRGIAEAHKNLGTAYYNQGNYKLGLEELFKALKISEQIGDKRNMGRVLHNVGATYLYQQDYVRALEFTKRSIEFSKSVGAIEVVASSGLLVCECYKGLNQPDNALPYCQDALAVFEKTGNKERQAYALQYLGGIYDRKNEPAKALHSYFRSLKLVKAGNFRAVGVYLNQEIAKHYMKFQKYDSAYFYLYQSLSQLKQYDSKDALMLAYQSLSDLHERVKRYDSALYYNKMYVEATRNDFNLRRNDQLASLEMHYNLELTSKELLLNQQVLKAQRNLLISGGIILGIVIVSSILIFNLYWRYRSANKQLIELNKSVNEKNEEILVQSEELKSINNAMQEINSNLEAIVEERTREVKIQNEKLIEFAYFNAHKVRGPLARILGLVNVLKMEDSNNGLKDFTDKIHESATELDNVIHTINAKLDKD
ncbi:MAG TPA: tetratricopeptide repeat protein [Cyclobacteriaceae bacterium]|nr:tetratricopeptide repeat protein [Cyclobacteriaceae bacterium]